MRHGLLRGSALLLGRRVPTKINWVSVHSRTPRLEINKKWAGALKLLRKAKYTGRETESIGLQK